MSDINNPTNQDLNDELSQQFALNLSALKTFMPDLYQRFCNYQPQNNIEFIPCQDRFDIKFGNNRLYSSNQPYTDCGLQVDNFIAQGKLSFARSKYTKDAFNQIHYRYYDEMVDVLAKSCDFESQGKIKDLACCPNLILFGCGLGYAIEHLYSKLEIFSMVVVEPNPDFFYASLYTTNYHGLLNFLHDNGYHLKFILGFNQETFFNELSDYYNNLGHALTSAFWAIIHYHSGPIDRLVQIFTQNYESFAMQGGFFDDSLFAISHAINNFKDTKNNLFLRADTQLSDHIKDIPVFIVGSGPSLSHDLEFIKANKDKAIIVSCGSSIEALYKAKIKPTFLACIERLRSVITIFESIKDPDYFKDIILITTEVTHPKVLAFFNKRIITLKAGESPCTLLQHFTPNIFKHFVALNYLNPLVSNLAISITLFLGFKNIYLFGLDNGSINPQQRHNDGCDFYKGIEQFYDTLELYRLDRPIKGNFEPQVYTCPMYIFAVSIMNLLYTYLQQHNGFEGKGYGKLYNCSNGMLIDCATPLHSEELDLSKKEPFSFDELWHELSVKKASGLTLSAEHFAKLEQALDLNRFKDFTNQLIILLKKREHGDTRTSYVAWMSMIQQEINKLKDTDELFIYAVLKDSFKYFFRCISNILFFSKSDLGQIIKDADFCVELMTYFLEDAQKLYAYLPNYCAEDHMKYVGNQVGWDHELSKAKNLFEY